MRHIDQVDADESFESGLSVGICRCVLTFIVCMLIASVSFIVATALARKVGANDIRNTLGIIIIGIVGSAFMIGGVAVVTYWLRGWSWSLTVSRSTLSWRTPHSTVSVALWAIDSIAIRYDDGIPALDITTSNGVTQSLPRACLFGGGALTQLCKLLRMRYPWIQVTYNWRPTCEVCGELGAALTEDHKAFNSLAEGETRHVCRRHRQDVARIRITVKLARTCLGLSATDIDTSLREMVLAHRGRADNIVLRSLHRADTATSSATAEDYSTWTRRVFENDYLLGFTHGIIEAVRRLECSIRYQQGYFDGQACWDVVCEAIQKIGAASAIADSDKGSA